MSDPFSDHLSTQDISRVMTFLNPLSAYKWIVACRHCDRANDLLLSFMTAVIGTDVSSVVETERSKVRYMEHVAKLMDNAFERDEDTGELVRYRFPGASSNKTAKEWATRIFRPRSWYVDQGLYGKDYDPDLSKYDDRRVELLFAMVDSITNRACVLKNYHVGPSYPVFLEHIQKAILESPLIGCVCASDHHDRQWNVRLPVGREHCMTYTEWLVYDLRGLCSPPMPAVTGTVNEDGDVHFEFSKLCHVPLGRDGWNMIREKVLSHIDRQCAKSDDVDVIDELYTRIQEDNEGIPMETEREEEEDGGDDDDGDDDGSLIIENLKDEYLPSLKEVRNLRNELEKGMTAIRDEFRNEILTWEDSGIRGTRTRLDRAQFQCILDGGRYNNDGVPTYTRSAIEYLQQIIEEIHFGKSWEVRLQSGGVCHVVLGRMGSCFFIQEDPSSSWDKMVVEESDEDDEEYTENGKP